MTIDIRIDCKDSNGKINVMGLCGKAFFDLVISLWLVDSRKNKSLFDWDLAVNTERERRAQTGTT